MKHITEKLKINSKSKIDNTCSIFDAECGDILRVEMNNDAWIVLFNKLTKYRDKNYANMFCYFTISGLQSNSFYANSGIIFDINKDNITYKLASDDECKLLFDKIKENNYLWDDKKMQLLKQ